MNTVATKASLDLVSTTVLLKSLEMWLDYESGTNSHSVGQKKAGGGVWKNTVLRFDSPVSDREHFSVHVDALILLAKDMGLARVLDSEPAVKAIVSVVIISTAVAKSFLLEKRLLASLADAGLDLEMCLYPMSLP